MDIILTISYLNKVVSNRVIRLPFSLVEIELLYTGSSISNKYYLVLLITI